jgi:hypothetical protein
MSVIADFVMPSCLFAQSDCPLPVELDVDMRDAEGIRDTAADSNSIGSSREGTLYTARIINDRQYVAWGFPLDWLMP